MSLQGETFEDKYINFFKFFSSKHTIQEIENYIKQNKIPSHSNSIFERIHLNMIDKQNLNILFHIIIRSDTDRECYEKLYYLIENYDINYNVFDFIHHRKLPFYTCVKGFLESTKYLIEKMNFNIEYKETDGKTLFFSAIKSYNVDLMEYLDKKYPGSIFFTDDEKNTCIFKLFKKNIKNKEESEKVKNIMRFILKRGFNIDQPNNEGITFREACKSYKIDNLLNEVIKEFGGEKEKNKENEINNAEKDKNISKEKNEKNEKNEKEMFVEKNVIKDKKEESKKKLEKIEKNKGGIKLNDNLENPIVIKTKLITREKKKEKNKEINMKNSNNFDYDIEMDDEFIENETKKELKNSKLKIKKEEKSDYNKKQNNETKIKICAFLNRKRHNLILKEEDVNILKNHEVFKKYFISNN